MAFEPPGGDGADGVRPAVTSASFPTPAWGPGITCDCPSEVVAVACEYLSEVNLHRLTRSIPPFVTRTSKSTSPVDVSSTSFCICRVNESSGQSQPGSTGCASGDESVDI